jgi:hypothetical protein
MSEDSRYICTACYFNHVETARAQFQVSKKLKLTCKPCGEKIAKEKKFTVLTPHKQGPMYFSPEFALEAAKGINNKGGLIK